MKNKFKKGFTLLEVLTVVLIAVVVTLFSVPAYKRSQDKNRYLAATGFLMDLGNAVRMMQEEYPQVTGISQKITGISTCSDEAASVAPTSANFVNWLYTNGYLNDILLSSEKYMGYSFAISAGGVGCPVSGEGSYCSASKVAEAIACMSGNNATTEYQCAWVDKSGNLHHN